MSLIISPYSFGGSAPSGKIWWGLNGTWQASGDPATGANPAYTGLSGTFLPAVSLYRGTAPKNKVTAAFAAVDLTYSPPSGFSAWTGAFNPSDKGAAIALTNTDRTAEKSSGTAHQMVRGTVSKSTGKHYFEVLVDEGTTSEFIVIGIATSAASLTTAVGVHVNSYGYYEDTGEKYNNNVLAAYGATYGNADRIMIAVEL